MLWIAKRIGVSLVLMWVVATVVFLALHMVPGDPAELLLSTGGAMPDAYAIAELREKLGLNRPIWEQYLAFLEGLSRGDLGNSLVDDYPVAEEILLRLPRTLELILAGTILSVLIALPAGTFAAVRAGGAFDRAASWIAALLQAVPVFVLGTLLILLLAQTLRWMPAGGYVPLAQDPARHLLLLSLPAIAIAKGLTATVFRMTRASVLDALSRDHVRTARAKGLGQWVVVLKHALRNAMIPILTVVGLTAAILIAGAIVTETVFGLPGVGNLIVSAVLRRDYPVIQGALLIVSGIYVLINLAVDLLYAVADPRVRY